MVKQRVTSNVGKVPWDCNVAAPCFADFKPKGADKSVPTPVNPGFRSTWTTWNWTEPLRAQGQQASWEGHLSPTPQWDAASPRLQRLSVPVPSLNLIFIMCCIVVFGVIIIIYVLFLYVCFCQRTHVPHGDGPPLLFLCYCRYVDNAVDSMCFHNKTWPKIWTVSLCFNLI